MEKKASYIMGLIKGLELEPDSKMTKAILALAEFSKSAAEEIEKLSKRCENLEEMLDEIHEEIEDFYDNCDCEGENDEDNCEVVCPNCGEKTCTNDLDDENLNCPGCGGVLDLGGEDCSED
ncbi:MAG: hypothetical protein LBK29_01640 [Oscillospiraceae bacterium]|jgi:hypothetical protein|nr:hypothetical protein [Oscillospiraceae bacterium]